MPYSLKKKSKWYTVHGDAPHKAYKKFYEEFPDLTTQYINIELDGYDYQIQIGTCFGMGHITDEFFEIFGLTHQACCYLLDKNRKELEWKIKKIIL